MSENIVVLTSDSKFHKSVSQSDASEALVSHSDKHPNYSKGDNLPTVTYGNRYLGSLAAPPHWIKIKVDNSDKKLLVPGYTVQYLAAQILSEVTSPNKVIIPISNSPNNQITP